MEQRAWSMERGAKGGGFKIRLRFTHHALRCSKEG